MIFDTHAHYDAEQFNEDRDLVLSALPEQNIGLVLNPGCDEETSRFALQMAEKYNFLYAAVGWHPENLETWNENSLGILRQLISHPKVKAIGEIGLDYYWDKEHKTLQKQAFEAQIQLALEYDLPVSVHDREAHEDTSEILFRYPALRGVLHCFSGSAESAKELLKRGWYLGFDGPITYKNNKTAPEVLAVTPLDRILVETDSPYLSPVPLRGTRNSSANLPYVIDYIAQQKGLEAKEIEKITYENGCRLFRIGPC